MSSLIPTLFHQADRLFYSHKLFVGFSVEFAQRIFMFITLGVRNYFWYFETFDRRQNSLAVLLVNDYTKFNL